MSLSTGQYIGQYRIVGKLGAGGMADIFRAHQENMGRDVAIKILKSEAGEAEGAERFRREARTIASLSHPHIIKVFDHGRHQDIFFLVMELLEGGTLADRIRRGPLPLETINTILSQVAQALDYIHNNGIVHRDLKPSNILFDRNGYAILTDFGISKRMGTMAALTGAGMAMGTLVYMAPEQLQGEPSDKRADVYALGVVLFEMLTGRLPYDGTDPYAVFQAKLNNTVPSVRQWRADAPAGVQQAIEKAMAGNPAARFQSTGELAAAFDSAVKGAVSAPSTRQSPAAHMPTIPESPSPIAGVPVGGDRTIPEMASPIAGVPVGGDRTLPEMSSPIPAARSTTGVHRAVGADRTMPELPSSPSSAPVHPTGPILQPTRPISEPRRPVLPFVLLGAALLVLIGGGAVLALVLNPTPTSQPTPTQVAAAATQTSAPTVTAVPTTAPTTGASPTVPAVIETAAPTEEATASRTPTRESATSSPPNDLPTEFVPLLRFVLRESESLKAENFNCRLFVQVMASLKPIAAGDGDEASDANDIIQNNDAKELLKYCSDPDAPRSDHALPMDQQLLWGNVRLLLLSTFARYAEGS